MYSAAGRLVTYSTCVYKYMCRFGASQCPHLSLRPSSLTSVSLSSCLSYHRSIDRSSINQHSTQEPLSHLTTQLSQALSASRDSLTLYIETDMVESMDAASIIGYFKGKSILITGSTGFLGKSEYIYMCCTSGFISIFCPSLK